MRYQYLGIVLAASLLFLILGGCGSTFKHLEDGVGVITNVEETMMSKFGSDYRVTVKGRDFQEEFIEERYRTTEGGAFLPSTHLKTKEECLAYMLNITQEYESSGCTCTVSNFDAVSNLEFRYSCNCGKETYEGDGDFGKGGCSWYKRTIYNINISPSSVGKCIRMSTHEVFECP
jgi:hypothetical protein